MKFIDPAVESLPENLKIVAVGKPEIAAIATLATYGAVALTRDSYKQIRTIMTTRKLNAERIKNQQDPTK